MISFETKENGYDESDGNVGDVICSSYKYCGDLVVYDTENK